MYDCKNNHVLFLEVFGGFCEFLSIEILHFDDLCIETVYFLLNELNMSIEICIFFFFPILLYVPHGWV